MYPYEKILGIVHHPGRNAKRMHGNAQPVYICMRYRHGSKVHIAKGDYLRT